MRPNRTTSTDRARGLARRRPIRRGRRLATLDGAASKGAEANEPAELQEELDEPEDEEHEPAARSKHSRPPAPAFFLRDDEDDEPAVDESAVDEPAGAVEEPVEEPGEIGTELSLATDDEDTVASSRERVLAHEEVPVSSELPLAERVTIPAVPQDDQVADTLILTPRDGGWLGAKPLTEAERMEQESFPPVVEELDEEEEVPVLSAEQLRRRGRLRRFVAVAVVAACAVTAGLVAKATLRPALGYAQRQGTASAARLVQQAAADARNHKAKQQAPAPAAPAAEEPALADDADYDAVSEETVRLLNAREFEKGAVLARRLIDMRPTSAFGYRCLGSALQDLNRMKEAREVYSECVTNATKGEVFECSALGGTAHKLVAPSKSTPSKPASKPALAKPAAPSKPNTFVPTAPANPATNPAANPLLPAAPAAPPSPAVPKTPYD